MSVELDALISKKEEIGVAMAARRQAMVAVVMEGLCSANPSVACAVDGETVCPMLKEVTFEDGKPPQGRGIIGLPPAVYECIASNDICPIIATMVASADPVEKVVTPGKRRRFREDIPPETKSVFVMPPNDCVTKGDVPWYNKEHARLSDFGNGRAHGVPILAQLMLSGRPDEQVRSREFTDEGGLVNEALEVADGCRRALAAKLVTEETLLMGDQDYSKLAVELSAITAQINAIKEAGLVATQAATADQIRTVANEMLGAPQ
ncbi:hypothetical protein FWD20_02785 [Candidatus Saccharibacteria bacterium]|nr:hypothetical protein [Candidatus Saccharibacteria bacterium]